MIAKGQSGKPTALVRVKTWLRDDDSSTSLTDIAQAVRTPAPHGFRFGERRTAPVSGGERTFRFFVAVLLARNNRGGRLRGAERDLMLNLDLRYARDVTNRAARGDPEALAFLSILVPADEKRLICDDRVGREGSFVMWPDPKMAGMAIIAAECLTCARRPDRHQREVAMLQTTSFRTWPISVSASRCLQGPASIALCSHRA